MVRSVPTSLIPLSTCTFMADLKSFLARQERNTSTWETSVDGCRASSWQLLAWLHGYRCFSLRTNTVQLHLSCVTEPSPWLIFAFVEKGGSFSCCGEGALLNVHMERVGLIPEKHMKCLRRIKVRSLCQTARDTMYDSRSWTCICQNFLFPPNTVSLPILRQFALKNWAEWEKLFCVCSNLCCFAVTERRQTFKVSIIILRRDWLSQAFHKAKVEFDATSAFALYRGLLQLLPANAVMWCDCI